MSEPRVRLREVKAILMRVVDCILKKAEGDDEFATQLQDILRVGSPAPKRLRKTAGPAGPAFDPVTFLHEHGEENLRATLSSKTEVELQRVLRAQGVKRPRNSQSRSIGELVEEIVQVSKRRLSQGTSFLRTL
ncbi:MAG: hypothetical protein AAB403_22625 [Planctomycetota bacterium]